MNFLFQDCGDRCYPSGERYAEDCLLKVLGSYLGNFGHDLLSSYKHHTDSIADDLVTLSVGKVKKPALAFVRTSRRDLYITFKCMYVCVDRYCKLNATFDPQVMGLRAVGEHE